MTIDEFMLTDKIKHCKICCKCYKPSKYVLKIKNKEDFTEKQYCGLCDNCLQDLKKFLMENKDVTRSN